MVHGSSSIRKRNETVMTFVEALYNQNLEAIRSFPKADLHNHFVLGGSREYIFNKTGYQIESITTTLKSKVIVHYIDKNTGKKIDTDTEIIGKLFEQEIYWKSF